MPVRDELSAVSNLTGKWTAWKEASCKTSCLENSTGVIIKRRHCEKENYSAANCEGPYYNIALCDDSKLCTKRKTIDEFATNKCNSFRNYYAPKINSMKGKQMPHNEDTPWTACTIFCRKNNDTSYSTVRVKLINVNVDPYFPDGTWCHIKDGQNYFCRKHYCLPKNYIFEKILS